MLYVVIFYLWASLLLYLLLGGADFGAGIIELFTTRANQQKTRSAMYKAIGPIWEANHMWLIISIVILFVGFPAIYTTLSVHLHIPLVIMLLGIIARGTAFTFRHYDAVIDDMQHIYNRVFEYSSFITPLFLGIIAGSAVSGYIDPQAHDFVSAYILSWLHGFPVAVGLFTVAICAFLASIYLIGETKKDIDRRRFIIKAGSSTVAAVSAGALVFITASIEGIPLTNWVFGNTVGITAIVASTLSLILLWYLLSHRRIRLIRLLAGFQVTMILLTTTYHHFPRIVLLKNGDYLSLLEHQGDAKTIGSLGIALLAGSIFILPALFFLMYSFQKKTPSEASTGGSSTTMPNGSIP